MELHTVADGLQDTPRHVIAAPEPPDDVSIGCVGGANRKADTRCGGLNRQMPGALREKFPHPHTGPNLMASDRAHSPAAFYDSRVSEARRRIAGNVNRAAPPEDHRVRHAK